MRAEHHFAHSLEGQPRSRWQGLRDHLEGVAAIAADLARSFGSGEWALLAGLWHDVGKYRHQFQAYIDPSAPETSGGDHAIGGALLARRAAGTQTQQLALAAVIAAHHAGLANLHDSEDGPPSPLMARLDRAGDQLTELSTTVPQDLLDHPLPPLPGFLAAPPRSDPERRDQVRRTELWIRFLLSALVDADRLDTEAFYDPETARARGRGFDSVAVLRQRLDHTIDELAAAAPATAVNQARGEVLARCRAAAAEEPGFFSLTVPTGGGKTLSALSFALRHAETHGLGRVITAIPYTSIIEQTARVFRQALNVPRGNDQVIEHHSNLDPEDETAQTAAALRRRWASETWDAPIIVTTNVQLFESLFSNRPSRCRKLHNVSRSVLVLDEAQSLPAHLLLPILDGLKALVEDYGCTVLFCTATQPALNRRPDFEAGIEGVREIMPAPRELARRLRRFRAELPGGGTEPTSWEELAGRIVEHPKVLAVVHRRQDAQDLAREVESLAEPPLHLSALMCPAHRREVLAGVRDRLARGRPCRLVSTQLIEAGVDVDFPVVFRALAGLDSLVQAAGRCNREGREAEGRFLVFRAPTEPPPGILARGLEQMDSLLLELGSDLDLLDPDLVARYFRRLYKNTELDARQVQTARETLRFATVARRFRLIEDGYTEPVCVLWGDAAERLERLRREGPHRASLRALQPFLVQVPTYRLAELEASGALETVSDGVRALSWPYRHLYDETYGLRLDDHTPPAAADWIV
ncbi:MAG: CRISPR-associated endonuclease Cas3'' [Acidobacteria bacterium]|nr:CRISPR-associated endonuclease Cas3'' [Acidobacteriota bacterium]